MRPRLSCRRRLPLHRSLREASCAPRAPTRLGQQLPHAASERDLERPMAAVDDASKAALIDQGEALCSQFCLYHGGQSMGWVPAARGREDLSRGFVFGAVRLPTPMAAEVRVRVGVRAPKRPSAAFLLRAGAKLTENDGQTFSNFSRCAKIEAPTRGLPFRAQSSRFGAPRRVKKINLKKVLYRGDGVHMALTQPLSVVAPRGSLSYPTDQRPSLVPAKTAGK